MGQNTQGVAAQSATTGENANSETVGQGKGHSWSKKYGDLVHSSSSACFIRQRYQEVKASEDEVQQRTSQKEQAD